MGFHEYTLVLPDNQKLSGKSNYYKNKECIKNLIEYVLQTKLGGARYIGALNVQYGTPKKIAKSIELIQKLCKKDNGRRMYHYILSGKGSYTNDDARQLYRVAEWIVQKYFGNTQIIYAVHENTENLHVHFVFSAVLINGYKWNCRRKEFSELKRAIELDACIAMNEDDYEYRNGKWYQNICLEEFV